jgi:Na+-driven multidrug efflux pump
MKETQRFMNRLSLVCMGLLTVSCGLVFLLFDPFAAMFAPTVESYPILRSVMYLFLFCTPPIWTASFVMPNMLRATGDARYPMAVSIASMFVLRVVGAWFFGVHLNWGLYGIWFSMVADWFVRGALVAPRVLTGGWKRARKSMIRDGKVPKAG